MTVWVGRPHPIGKIDKTQISPCHSERIEESRGNETSIYIRHFTSFRYREIATLALAMTKFFICARNENLFVADLSEFGCCKNLQKQQIKFQIQQNIEK